MESKHDKISEVVVDDCDIDQKKVEFEIRSVPKRTYTKQDHIAKWKKVHKRRAAKKAAKRSK